VKQQDNEEKFLLKVVAHWFVIPRIWRRFCFWLLVFILAIMGWYKLLFS